MLINSTLSFRQLRALALSAAILCITGLSACKHDDLPKGVYKIRASLDGRQEVPPNNSMATGKLKGTYNSKTRVLKYDLWWEGLTGPAAAMHFHGPADPGQNAGVAVGIMGFPMMPAGQVSGIDTLTEEQGAHLLGGKFYVNIHTKMYPGGEIRGQVWAKR